MGEVFAGRYELLEPIASGGMGTVWLVEDHQDGRRKAAKILRQSDASSLLRFVREQSLRVEHPHVVTPLSWAGTDDRVLFTMPLVGGGSVTSLLHDHGALPLPWIGVLLDQLLDALVAVHAAGLVHRDVKPSNLLLEPTGTGRPHLRLTDFGIAVPLDEPRLTHVPSLVGSPGYLAPEQARGADPHPRQDLYAAGVVGLEMLTGRRPSGDLADPDPRPVVTHLPDPAAASGRLVELLRWASAPRPEDRPVDAATLRGALAALRLAELPGAGRVTVPERFGSVATPPTAPPTTPPTARTGAQTGAPTARPTAASTAVATAPATALGTAVAPAPDRAGPARRRAGGWLLLALGLACLAAAAVVALA